MLGGHSSNAIIMSLPKLFCISIDFSGDMKCLDPSICDLTSTSFALTYTDVTDTNKGNAQMGTISGTTITAGGSEYNFDSGSSAGRIATACKINSTQFGVIYLDAGGTGHLSVKIGVNTGTTVIAFSSALVLYSGNAEWYADGSQQFFSLSCAYGNIYFSYKPDTYHITVMGGVVSCGYNNTVFMVTQRMKVRVATAGIGEQIEISSVYFLSNIGFSNLVKGRLYLNGTTQDKRFKTFENPSSTAQDEENEKLANCPIILKEGESLYAGYSYWSQGSGFPSTVTVFGIKRTA